MTRVQIKSAELPWRMRASPDGRASEEKERASFSEPFQRSPRKAQVTRAQGERRKKESSRFDLEPLGAHPTRRLLRSDEGSGIFG